MEWIAKNLGQVAVIVAAITFIGVIVKAVTDWFTTSRSKYVDVIAAERIKWVGELRSDVREFGFHADEVSHQFRQKPFDQEAANKALESASRHLNNILLKLNLGDPLDLTVLALISRVGAIAKTGSLQEYAMAKSALTRYASYLLKDEWEKAKREAAGPVRWIWLELKRRKRQRVRDASAQTKAIKAELHSALEFLSEEERAIVVRRGALSEQTR